jgi:hypothetical protein
VEQEFLISLPLFHRPQSPNTLTIFAFSPFQRQDVASMIPWDKCKDDFRPDGSLRDIYIAPAALDDWLLVYPILRDYPGAEYSMDGVVQASPDTQVGNPMLRLNLGHILIVFHFFSEYEIECDFVPKEITSQADLDALLAFVRKLGDVTHKRVRITPENLPTQPAITYDPEDRSFSSHRVQEG